MFFVASSAPLVQLQLWVHGRRVSRWLAAALQEGYRLCGCAGGAASLAAQADDCECLPDECYGAVARARTGAAQKPSSSSWFSSVLPPLAAHLPYFGLSPLWGRICAAVISCGFIPIKTDRASPKSALSEAVHSINQPDLKLAHFTLPRRTNHAGRRSARSVGQSVSQSVSHS